MKNPGKNVNFTGRLIEDPFKKVFSTRCSRRYLEEEVEVIRLLGKFHNYELPNYHFSPVITFVIAKKSRNIDWTQYVVCMKEMRKAFLNFI
jgi:hypothetical protein